MIFDSFLLAALGSMYPGPGLIVLLIGYIYGLLVYLVRKTQTTVYHYLTICFVTACLFQLGVILLFGLSWCSGSNPAQCIIKYSIEAVLEDPMLQLFSIRTQLNFYQQVTKVDQSVRKQVKSEKVGLLALKPDQ